MADKTTTTFHTVGTLGFLIFIFAVLILFNGFKC
jgi:hypothetical protein